MSMSSWGSGLSSIGTVIDSIATILANQAMESAFKNQMAQQAAFQNQAMGVWNNALPSWGAANMQQQVQQGAANREKVYGQVGTAPQGSPVTGGRGPSARDNAQMALQGHARAGLGGYSDWQLERTINNLQTQNQLNKISSFAGGTASMMPYQMYDAQHSADPMFFLGGAARAAAPVVSNWDMFKGPLGDMFGFNKKVGVSASPTAVNPESVP